MVLLVSVLSVAPVQAQMSGRKAASRLPLRFEHFTQEDGLSQGSVGAMLQDRQGFLWFGTQDGLNRYDGTGVTVFRDIPFDTTTLSNGWTISLYEDRAGNIWVGTAEGLNRLDPHTGRSTRFVLDPAHPTNTSSAIITALQEDRRGILWVGTAGAGLYRLDPRSGDRRAFRYDEKNPTSISDNGVLALHIDRAGMLWVATTNGLNRMDPRNGRFRRYFDHPEAKSNTVNHLLSGIPGARGVRMSSITSLCDDPAEAGILWVGTEGGLIRMETSSGKSRTFIPDPTDADRSVVTDLVPDPRQRSIFWVATLGGGLYRFDAQSGQFAAYRHDSQDPYSLKDDSIFKLLVDRTGLIWAGSYFSGVARFDPAGVRFQHLKKNQGEPNTLVNNVVWSIAEDHDGGLWIGTNNGLDYLDRRTGRYTHFQHGSAGLAGTSMFTLYVDREGTVWIGTQDGGLNRFDRRTRRFKNYRHAPSDPNSLIDNFVSAMLEDRSGTFWVGTSLGLHRMDRKRGTFMRYTNDPKNPASISDNYVTNLKQDASGAIWVGTANGLNRFDPVRGTFTRFKNDPRNPATLGAPTVLTLHERKREPGILWIGTEGGGLNRLDTRTGRFTHYLQEDGLPNDHIYGILEDDSGQLWVSTNAGLSRFDPERRRFTNYGVDSGLQSNEFNQNAYFRSARTGEMFFGGMNGFNIFHPGRIVPNPVPPAVVLTGLKISYETVPVGPGSPLQVPISLAREIRLKHWQKTLTFEFIGLHFQNPTKNRYAYRLEGFDDEWVQAGTQRSATYTNLDPGTYTFHVRAANADGVWNDKGATLRVIVLPPWWRTWWAYALYAMLLVATIFSTDRYFRARLIRREREQAFIREKELRAEAAEAWARSLQTENDRKTKELEHARALQLSMLPRDLPQHPALAINAYMQTATEVGGDYYDFAVSADGSLTFAIGDATGHGVQAGTMVTATKSLWNALSGEPDLEAIMAKANDALKRLRLPRLYMAFALGRIRGDELEVIGAGMPPALIYRGGTGTIEQVPLKGLPLGSPGKAAYRSRRLKLEPGDILVLMSDGFPEMRREGLEMLGYDHALELVREATTNYPEEIIPRLAEQVAAWNGEQAPADDVTFLVIRVKPVAEPLRAQLDPGLVQELETP